ncbi:MAG: hypothetical protein ACKOEO_17305 [Planctomycetaceae bacterium]
MRQRFVLAVGNVTCWAEELVVGAAFGGVQRDFVPPADRPVESCLFFSLLASEPGGPRVFGIVLNLQ